MQDTPKKPIVAVIGGTGELGSGLVKLWTAAGYSVVIGSRSKDKAQAAARDTGKPNVTGDDNGGAARSGDVVILSIPFAQHDAIVAEIKPFVAGKIVVDAVVPLVPPKVSVVQLPAAGSPALVAQRAFGPETRMVAAFHSVGAKKLQNGEKADCDVLVFGDDAAAKEIVIGLANEIATRGVDGGALANAVAAEALTSVLIAINRRYKSAGAGIRITGISP
ncbi:MAG: NADPH-dependent F420 reductase [Pseudolabrys sp.]|nr:NADPH-dependent F420 reductase [Pseudolabrys sp.]